MHIHIAIRSFALISSVLVSLVANAEPAKIGDKVYVVATELNVREQPNFSSKVTATIPITTEVEIVHHEMDQHSADAKWTRISATLPGPIKIMGWVLNEYLSVTRPTFQILEEKFWQTPEDNVDQRVLWAERILALAPNDARQQRRLAEVVRKRTIYRNSPEELRRLARQIYLVKMVNGKVSLSALAETPSKFDYQKYFQKPCIESIAYFPLLNGARGDVSQDDKVTAILACGVGPYGPNALVAAVFSRSSLIQPLCSSIVDIGPGELSVLGVRDLRRTTSGNYNVIAGIGGGDAGQVWESVILFQLRPNCSYTSIHRESAGGHLGDADTCNGERLQLRFVNETSVEITRQSLECVHAMKAMKPIKKIVHFPK